MDNKPTKQQAYNDSVVESLKFLITNSDQSWRKEWASDGYRQQGYKGNEYINTNQLVLFRQAYQNNYTDPRWMTFNQVVENGYKLEKGSKASTVLFYTNTKRELNRDENGKPRLDENGNKTYKNVRLDRPVAVSYNVFNATKIEGIEPFILKQDEQNRNTQELMSAAELIKLSEGTRKRNDSVNIPSNEIIEQQIDNQRINNTAIVLAEIGNDANNRGTAARFTIDNLPTDFEAFVSSGNGNKNTIHALSSSGNTATVLTGLNEYHTKEVLNLLSDINPADIREFARHQEDFKRDDVMTPAQFAEFAQERKHEAINEVKELYPSLDLNAIRAIQYQDNVRFSHSETGELFAHSDNGDHSLSLTGAPLVDWNKGEEILSDLHANNELGALIEAYQPLTGVYLERERPLSIYTESGGGITIEAESGMFEAIKTIPDNWGGEIAKMGEKTLINVINDSGKEQYQEFKPDINDLNYNRLFDLMNQIDEEAVEQLKTDITNLEEEQELKRPKVEEYQPTGHDLVEQRLLHNLYQWLKSDDGYEIQRQDANAQETIGTVPTEAEAIDITDWLNNFNGLPQAEKNEAIAQLEQKQEQALLGFNDGDIALTNSDNPNAPQLPDYAKIDHDVAAYIENHGLRLQEMASERAFFSNGGNSNVVVVPLKKQFGDNQDAYYATLFHELTHSTKLLENSRQGFETDLPTGNEFGSQNYAREELVAEVGALLLCQHYGINSFVDPDNEKISDLTQNSVAYLKNWIEAGDLNDSDISKAVTEAKRSTNAITGQTLLIANKIEQSEKQEVKQVEGMKV